MVVKLKLIVAASENMGIGKNGDLPWRLKNEMAYFSRMTSTTVDKNRKNVVIMGRRTWDCIPSKFKPLPNRINFVLSRSDLDLSDYLDTFAFKSFEDAYEKLHDEIFRQCYEDVWVIGGSSIYKEALESPNFHKLYLTKVHKHFDCDTFLPEIPDFLKQIKESEVPEGIQEENGLKYTYHVYVKS